jgi:hypothetical protein
MQGGKPVRRLSALFVLFCASLLALQAGASVVTSIPGGTVIPMPAINYFGSGPQTFGTTNPVTWSSSNAFNQGGSVFGYTGGYSYLGNGSWDGSLGPMAGLNDSKDFFLVTDTMEFTFASPVSAVGGFLNYAPGSSNPTTIAVYDVHGNLIESFNLMFLTGGGANTGAFYGFQENGAIIKSFTLSDNFIGITNLTAASVPEPSSLLLIGTGLLAAIGSGRRRLGL